MVKVALLHDIHSDRTNKFTWVALTWKSFKNFGTTRPEAHIQFDAICVGDVVFVQKSNA
ncbi:MAG: hypothetical protein ACUVQM_04365 [Candidatus Hadarchaeaceae archaeon]